MEPCDREAAVRLRARLERGLHSPLTFRSALLAVPKMERDAWANVALGLDDLPPDGPDLPRGCVPYLPCPVDALLRIVDQAPIGASDVFVDIGAGAARAAALVQLLTGATVVGLEIQAELVRAARALAERLRLPRVTIIQADASTSSDAFALGTVFFLYCPFSGERVTSLLDALEPSARRRSLCIACVDVALPDRPWLARDPVPGVELALYRTTLHTASTG